MSSTRTLVTLLRPWIRRFTIIISAWWLRTSSKFTWEEVKTSTGKLGKWSTPKRVRTRPKYSAPSLSRDRRIKMHQSINQSIKSKKKKKKVFTQGPSRFSPELTQISSQKPESLMPNLQRGGPCLNFAHFTMQFCNPSNPKGGGMAQ